jgi:hypothetical protein
MGGRGSGKRGGGKGGRKGREVPEGGGKERQRELWEEGRGPTVEQWKPVFDKVEAHQHGRKKRKLWSQER